MTVSGATIYASSSVSRRTSVSPHVSSRSPTGQGSLGVITASCFFSSRRRHTRLQGDWSSDVCSSDLHGIIGDWSYHALAPVRSRRQRKEARQGADERRRRADHRSRGFDRSRAQGGGPREDRKSVV